jgi:uncharacterized protein YuzE
LSVTGWRERMKIEYDPTHDLLNIEFISEEAIAESAELDGVIVDYSKDGRIVAIEILDAGKGPTKSPLNLIDLSIVKGDNLKIPILPIFAQSRRSAVTLEGIFG